MIRLSACFVPLLVKLVFIKLHEIFREKNAEMFASDSRGNFIVSPSAYEIGFDC